MYYINVREHRRDNRQLTIQRNWQHSVHKTTKNKAKAHHSMCWTLPYTSKHKQSKEDSNRFWPFCFSVTYSQRLIYYKVF